LAGSILVRPFPGPPFVPEVARTVYISRSASFLRLVHSARGVHPLETRPGDGGQGRKQGRKSGEALGKSAFLRRPGRRRARQFYRYCAPSALLRFRAGFRETSCGSALLAADQRLQRRFAGCSSCSPSLSGEVGDGRWEGRGNSRSQTSEPRNENKSSPRGPARIIRREINLNSSCALSAIVSGKISGSVEPARRSRESYRSSRREIFASPSDAASRAASVRHLERLAIKFRVPGNYTRDRYGRVDFPGFSPHAIIANRPSAIRFASGRTAARKDRQDLMALPGVA
jgi:hypothetical protein